MLFNSFAFLAFFTAFVIVYYSVPHRYRCTLLVAASLCFYASFNPRSLWVLLGMTGVAYATGMAIGASGDQRRKRAILAAGIVAVLGPLFVVKYYDFLAASLDALFANVADTRTDPLLPRLGFVAAAGLSFYTFSCVSYVADVYAGLLAPEWDLGRFTLYVSFFPKLLAGPIERAKPFLSQLSAPVSFSGSGVTAGLQLMLWGLFKKVVIADRLAGFVDGAYGQPAFTSPADLLLATYFFAFQLYCDFSGYSDIAIGAAKVLGFDLMDNFRRPYLSTSVREFWANRWHLSLTTWFRDYMYIPMGGRRVSTPRRCVNVMAVFLASGLWHGANWTFVVWGGLNGAYQVVSLLTAGARRRLTGTASAPSAARSLVSALVTFHLILITWIFFRASSLSDATTILSRVTAAVPGLPLLLWNRLSNGEILQSLALVAVLLVIEALDEVQTVWARLRARPLYVRWAVY